MAGNKRGNKRMWNLHHLHEKTVDVGLKCNASKQGFDGEETLQNDMKYLRYVLLMFYVSGGMYCMSCLLLGTVID